MMVNDDANHSWSRMPRDMERKAIQAIHVEGFQPRMDAILMQLRFL